jgi:ABC-2 type transport system permease protein
MTSRTPFTLLLHQTRFDLKAIRANRQARFSTLLMPLVLLVVVVGVTGDEPIGDQGVTLAPATYFAPGLIAFAVLASSFLALLVELVVLRETGVLKRRRARPVPAWTLVGGRALAAVATSLAVAALLLIVATNGYDAAVPAAAIPAIVVLIVAGAVSFSALAFALSTAIRSSAAAQPVAALVALPLFLISGVFFPASKLPATLEAVATAFPLAHLAHGLRHAILPGAGGIRLAGSDLAVLIAWGLVGFAVAVRRFEWLPRTGAGAG